MRKYWLLLMLLCLVLVPTDVNASSSFVSYGPVGTISTPYPTITALVHMSNSYLLLNETKLYLGLTELSKNFTATLGNTFPDGADITISYQSQKWLSEGSYTVGLQIVYVTGSTKTTLPIKQWVFTIAYDAATKAMFTISSTLTSVNSTVFGLRHDYNTTIGQWLPTLQTMNNTMQYWNNTMQVWSNMASNINAMFSSTGTVGVFMTDARNYFTYFLWGFGVLGGLILILCAVLAIIIVRRTESSREALPPVLSRSYPSAPYPAQPPPSYPPPPTGPPPSSAMPPPSGVCPNCGHQNRQQAMFCANCKTKLIQGGPQPS